MPDCNMMPPFFIVPLVAMGIAFMTFIGYLIWRAWEDHT